MKKLVLEIKNKRDLDQLLLEIQRLNIRIISYEGTQIADSAQQSTSESANISTIPTGKRLKITDQEIQKQRIKGPKSKQKTSPSGKSPKKDRKIAKSEASQTQIFQWRFSNHVFSGAENKTFSREEIYEDAEWEKNIH